VNGKLKNISLFKLRNSKFNMEAFAGIDAIGFCFGGDAGWVRKRE
jgi:hypothetical protein